MMNLFLFRNPVLLREARVRVRGWRAAGLVSLYVGLLGLIVLFFLWMSAQENMGGGFSPQVGGTLFAFLVYAQGALLFFSAPGLTAGAISGERERQTLDLLLITRLSPMQVVAGKLGAALSFTLLLMVASAPVYALLFLFGGVSVIRLLMVMLVYLVTVLLLGSLGLYFSALLRRTQAAVVAAYGVALGWLVGSLFMGILTQQILYRNRTPWDVPPAWTAVFAYLNPTVALGAAAGGPAGEIATLFRKIIPTPQLQEAIWWKYCLIGLLLVGGLLWLTARRIEPLKNK